MAGNYPDPPVMPRMAYDRDGTVGFNIDPVGGGVTVVANSVLIAMNDEDTDIGYIHGGGGGLVWGGLLFPTLMDIVGVYITTEQMTSPQTSVDTTNGQDGAWVGRTTINAGSPLKPAYRTVTTVSWLGVKAVRWQRNNPYYDYFLYALHLYGRPSAGQSPDRLRFWHSVLDREVEGVDGDFGNGPHGTVSVKQVRIKNNSPTLTANLITLSLQAPTDASPTLLYPQHSLSLDGVSYAATQQITSLAPGATSGLVHIKRNTPSNGALSLWNLRLNAVAASWT